MQEQDETHLFGTDLFGDVVKPKAAGPVAERFTMPPFTLLDGRGGDWLERKRAWLAIGIKSEESREDVKCYGSSAGSFMAQAIEERGGTVSIFDPVLCELVYRWWSAPGAQVVDPFAGGSVRGIVAGFTGRQYWGCDLREAQVVANRQQAVDLAPHVLPVWACGDSLERMADAPLADMVFSCPPYGDLEVYSDDPNDLSAMEWPAFVVAYRAIIAASVARLRPDSFACFVVGDFRDKGGHYRNFVGHTVDAFLAAGCTLYNEAILVTPVGTAALRVTRQFTGGRKLCKTHQNVLVFCKGDWRKATDKCNAGGVPA